MKLRIFSALIGLVLTTQVSLAQADDCLYAYKAKRDNPLQLHYGVMAIQGRCEPAAAKREAAERLQASGWSLLVLLERVEPAKLNQYKETAGEYFLRY